MFFVIPNGCLEGWVFDRLQFPFVKAGIRLWVEKAFISLASPLFEIMSVCHRTILKNRLRGLTIPRLSIPSVSAVITH
jgi:hypothetical protein